VFSVRVDFSRQENALTVPSHFRHAEPAVPPAPLAGACSLFLPILKQENALTVTSHFRHAEPAVFPAPLAGACSVFLPILRQENTLTVPLHFRHAEPAVFPAPLAGACSLFVLIFEGKKILLLYPCISVTLGRQYLLPPWLVRVLCFSLFVLNQRQEAPVSVSAKLRHAELAVPLAPLAGVCLG